MPIVIGQSISHYHILEQLGEGGMATVYKAYDTHLDRDVAIKVIRRAAFPPEQLEHMLKRFDREAKALAKLTNPNIVGVIDYGQHKGTPYLVMPYIPGGTLKQRLGRPIPWQDSARLLLSVARALQYAHAQGIIHRDVKPSNILITQSGDPMLTDFGIAKIIESDETTTLTGTGMGVGTPEYMAPEQWDGKVNAQSDVYALGVVFYEMVTGRKPYVADTPRAIMLKQATEPLPPPRKFVPDLPDAVERVLIKALTQRVENRYSDMSAFSAALEQLALGKIDSKQTSTSFNLIPSLQGNLSDSQQTRSQTNATFTQGQETTHDLLPASPNATSAPTTQTITQSQPPNRRPPWGWIIGIGSAACLGFVGVLILLTLPALRPDIPTQQPVTPTWTFANPSTETIPPTATFTLEPTITSTPIPQPRMYNFQACPNTCNGYNAQNTFPEKTTIIYLQWDYENIPPGASYVRFSSFSGMDWARYECTWPNPSSGTENITFTEPAGIRSGTWYLAVIINGETLLNEMIVVEGNWDYWDPAGYFDTCYGKR